MSASYHYPPELMTILKDAIPKLCKSKRDLLTFFKGCGIQNEIVQPFETLLKEDKENFNKYRVTAELLEKINELGDNGIRLRRELLKRVTEIEDFSICWENDQAAARGLVSQIRDIVNVKDSFTRMRNEKEAEQRKRIEAEQAAITKNKEKADKIEKAKSAFFALFGEDNPHTRGKRLEKALTDLFDAFEITVKEAFTVKAPDTDQVVEQIDGMVELEGHIYLTEMKWWKNSIGVAEISPHLVRVFSRGGQARAFFISYSNFTEPAIQQCRDALAGGAIVCLVQVEEIVDALNSGADLKKLLKKKVQAAISHKNPLFRDVA